MVGSFRLDHEDVEVDSTFAPWLATVPPTGPASISADHWVPLWGFGMGNDFGNRNETYFSASSGWRPTRFFDIAGTSRTIAFGESIPDPFHSLDFELGVHGTPYKGFCMISACFGCYSITELRPRISVTLISSS